MSKPYNFQKLAADPYASLIRAYKQKAELRQARRGQESNILSQKSRLSHLKRNAAEQKAKNEYSQARYDAKPSRKAKARELSDMRRAAALSEARREARPSRKAEKRLLSAARREKELRAARSAARGPLARAAVEGLQDVLRQGPKAAVLGAAGLAAPAIISRLAGKPSLAKRLVGEGTIGRKALTLGGAAALVGGGIAGVDKLYSEIKKPLQRKSYMRKMLNFSPSLKREDQKAVKSIFNTLYKFNPKMASDPLVASSFLKRSLQFKDEGIQPMDVKTLTEVGKNLQQSKSRGPSVLSDAFPTTAAALSGLGG